MDDADIAELFAPIEPAKAFGVVLREAQDVLSHIHGPADAELWGSDMIGALAPDAAAAPEVMSVLATAIVPAAEESSTPEALALLRIFGAIGSAELRAAATEAAGRVVAAGVPDPDWAATIGAPAVGTCWHYGDVGGRQESVTATFAYGDDEHALSVLIDHGRGGGLKDVWVGDARGLLDKTYLAAEADPLVVFETIGATNAGGRLEQAISAGEHPDKPDQADDLTAHRALLHARVRLLAAAAAADEAEG